MGLRNGRPDGRVWPAMLKNKRDDKLNAGLQRCPHPEGIDSAGNGKLLKKTGGAESAARRIYGPGWPTRLASRRIALKKRPSALGASDAVMWTGQTSYFTPCLFLRAASFNSLRWFNHSLVGPTLSFKE